MKSPEVPAENHDCLTPARTTYTTPVLRVFGAVRTLTQGNSGTSVDGGSQNPKPR